jgi:putative ABC transport system substrate-binding protein
MLGIIASQALWPTVVRAQPTGSPVIGFLNPSDAKGYEQQLAAFHKGLAEAGYVEGKNVRIEYRWAEGHPERLAPMAAELVQRQVTVIAATAAPAALAAKTATGSIPVVFETGEDPVALGLVSSLNRPGGNVTGAASLVGETMAKELELLHELAPGARDVAVLIGQVDPLVEAIQVRRMQAAARALGLQLHVLRAANASEIEPRFADLKQLNVGGLVVGFGSLAISNSKRLAELSLQHRIPAVYNQNDFVAAGGLASYGGDLLDGYRLAGVQVGRVLKGAKPADLPVEQTTKMHLYINRRTALELGLDIPPLLLSRADEVIE